MPEVRRPHLRFPACQYPSARTRGPAEPVLDHTEGAGGNVLAVLELSQRPLGPGAPAEPFLDHAEGAGGNVLAVLELSQRPLGPPGRLGKGPPVPHA